MEEQVQRAAETIVHLKVDGVEELLTAKLGAANTRIGPGHSVGLVADPAGILGSGASGRLLS